jgi:transcriptional regulator with XRE-family HTH domain
MSTKKVGSDLFTAAGESPGNEVLVRGAAPDLGPSLRRWRKDSGLTLTVAADELDVSISYLQRLETGAGTRPPKLVTLQRMAAVYNVSTDDVFAAAGVTSRRVRDAGRSIDRAFRRYVLDPRIRPAGMDEVWLESFSTKQKKQWLESAQRAEALTIKEAPFGGRPINDIITGRRALADEEGDE